ncbi:hypothetical protein PPL_05132 [Heterostelium album PN500]|uniref:Uncharacterized protein n=1 Tax=Heterostelium pallidum (strain ATCC 26659 / Pp 5 / PN500) TaxID=670386 RepID=D3B9I8_HETP5|nr:hypothetical protein PPL_05132 [Heterostelium album PN500]EFA81900.1 hypothetical protein PPL_05132 [Heterostelium album PN500]|eukprot:XP_020434017.1 hypothetical protein PPL_05132 [Heterostelium album PN500]
MNSYKENILNASELNSHAGGIQDLKRQPLQPVKQQKTQVLTPPNNNSSSQKSVLQPQQVSNNGPSQLQQSQGRRIVELEKKLKEFEEMMKNLQIENDQLHAQVSFHDQSRANVLINNNRLRLVHRLREENQMLHDQVEALEEMVEQSTHVDPLVTKQNGIRARKIQQLTKENAELNDKLQQANETIRTLNSQQQQRQPTSLSTSTTQNINYSHNRNLTTSRESNYGMEEHHLPGEC